MKLIRADWIPRRTQGFVCSLEERGGEVVGVDLAGELRAAAVPELARTIRRAERDGGMVVLDLRRLTFLDPCAAHVILAAAIRARRAGRRLVVVHGPAPIGLGFASKSAVDVVELAPSQPAVQALLELAREERAA